MIVHMKLHIPHVRPRLTHMLNKGMRVKLTKISAQASYGKTTLLSEWTKQGGSRIAWLSLDARDNELGIIEGIGAIKFAPEICTTRAEAVTILLKMLAQQSK